MEKQSMEIRYLSTDLDIESTSDLSALVDELGEDVIVLHHGPISHFKHASFQLAQASYGGPDEVLEGYCNLVENLSVDARKIWDSCFTRVFDVGISWGALPQRYRFELRPSTLKRVTGIGASVAVSLYPEEVGSITPH